MAKSSTSKPGYLSIYEEEKVILEKSKQDSCARLGHAWSDPAGVGKKKRCPRCRCWVTIKSYDEPRSVITRLGTVTYTRHYYYCKKCRFGFYPKDEKLGISLEDMTEDVIELALDFDINDPFAMAAQRMRLHHAIDVSATKLQHLFIRQSEPFAAAQQPHPVVPLPLRADNQHRPVVIEDDGSMVRMRDGWHEIKLMMVQVLGEDERVYLAEGLCKERFEGQLRESQGYAQLADRTVLWISDGAAFNWNLQQRLCPHAWPLLDFYHMREHLYDCAKTVLADGEGDGAGLVSLFVERASGLLLSGQVAEFIEELQECRRVWIDLDGTFLELRALHELSTYIENNRNRLGYREFLDNGWPIGSGAIESAHRWVIQKRMKQGGMRWSRDKAHRMASMRALYASVGPWRFFNMLQKTTECSAA